MLALFRKSALVVGRRLSRWDPPGKPPGGQTRHSWPASPSKGETKEPVLGMRTRYSLLGRQAVTRSPPGLHRPEGRFHTIHMGGERAWQKMSRAFFTPFGKTCHVLLPMISAKDVAFILRQNVTILNKQYLLSFPLTLQQREEVLTIRMLRFA